tara:strand:- start:1924 stop:2286 length:363 start_codon:yes stop_codon:yes gene_type:complete
LHKLYKKKNINIGILGGTFDPPHKGHLYISKIAIRKLKLNKLIWIVTKKNPLKKNPFLNLKSRINLAKKMTRKDKKIYVKYYDDKVKSFHTFKLLKYIKKKKPKKKIIFSYGVRQFSKIA